jgi:hypothetical protein
LLCTVPEAYTCAPTGASTLWSTYFEVGAPESVYAHVVGLMTMLLAAAAGGANATAAVTPTAAASSLNMPETMAPPLGTQKKPPVGG